MPSNIKMPPGEWFVPSGYALHNLITKAIKRDDKVFHHLAINPDGETFEVGTYLNLPSPQRTGTLYQQDTYAKAKAWEFMKNHKLS